MKFNSFEIRWMFLVRCAVSLVLLFTLLRTEAQTPRRKNVEQELVRTETGFFEAWKTKDLAYFRDHIPANGLFWGENGSLSRDQQLQQQEAAAKNCAVDGYGLSDFQVLQIATGAYLLTYRSAQYATCGGEKMPVHMNGSSVYVFKSGRWQAIYRAQVPLQNQT
jgi:hypothetical protein